MDDVPDFGDVDGLRRLYESAKGNVRAMNIPEAERRRMLAEIEAAYLAATATDLGSAGDRATILAGNLFTLRSH